MTSSSSSSSSELIVAEFTAANLAEEHYPVRSVFPITKGVFYYEASPLLLLTGDELGGRIRFGWTNRSTELNDQWPEEIPLCFYYEKNLAIGLQTKGQQFDGIFHYNYYYRKLSAEDVEGEEGNSSSESSVCPVIIGCLIDADRREFQFFFNGKPVRLVQPTMWCTNDTTTTPYYAMVSFERREQRCALNFGQTEFRFPPPPNIHFDTFHRAANGDVACYQLAHTRVMCENIWFAHPLQQPSTDRVDYRLFDDDLEQSRVDSLIQRYDQFKHQVTHEEICSILDSPLRVMQSVLEVITTRPLSIYCSSDRIAQLVEWCVRQRTFYKDYKDYAKLFELLYQYFELSPSTTCNLVKRHNASQILLLCFIGFKHEDCKLVESLLPSAFQFYPAISFHLLSPTMYLRAPGKVWTTLDYVLDYCKDPDCGEVIKLIKNDTEELATRVHMFKQWFPEWSDRIDSVFGVDSDSSLAPASSQLRIDDDDNDETAYLDERLQSIDPELHLPKWSLNPSDQTGQVILCNEWSVVVNTDQLDHDFDLEPDKWQSIRSVRSVNTGLVFYEVTLITDGEIRFGWATGGTDFSEGPLGDGEDSVAIERDEYHRIAVRCDGRRLYGSDYYEPKGSKWLPGDVFGCLVDFEWKQFHFFRNGSLVEFSPEYVRFCENEPYFAAISLASGQKCYINFGQSSFKYPPSFTSAYKTFYDLFSTSTKQTQTNGSLGSINPSVNESYRFNATTTTMNEAVLSSNRIEPVFSPQSQAKVGKTFQICVQFFFGFQNDSSNREKSRQEVLEEVDNRLMTFRNVVRFVFGSNPRTDLMQLSDTGLFEAITVLNESSSTSASHFVSQCTESFTFFDKDLVMRHKALQVIQALIECEWLQELGDMSRMAIWLLPALLQCAIDNQMFFELIWTVIWPYTRLVLNPTTETIHRNVCLLLSSLLPLIWDLPNRPVLKSRLFDYLTAIVSQSTDDKWLVFFAFTALSQLKLEMAHLKALQTNKTLKANIKSNLIISTQVNFKLSKQKFFEKHLNFWSKHQFVLLAQWSIEEVIDFRHVKSKQPEITLELCDPSNTAMKLSKNQLSVRYIGRDGFGSVRSNRCVDYQLHTKRYYFEVTLDTSGPMRIGFAAEPKHPESQLALQRLGDDKYSVGFDGYHRCIWHKGQQYRAVWFGGNSQLKWTVGDVVGCAIDCIAHRFRFFLNGKPVTGFLALPWLYHFSSVHPYYAAATLTPLQQCRFAFKNKEFKLYCNEVMSDYQKFEEILNSNQVVGGIKIENSSNVFLSVNSTVKTGDINQIVQNVQYNTSNTAQQPQATIYGIPVAIEDVTEQINTELIATLTKITNTRFWLKDIESLEDHFTEFDRNVTRYRQLGGELSDSQVMEYLRNSIPYQFSRAMEEIKKLGSKANLHLIKGFFVNEEKELLKKKRLENNLYYTK